MVIIKRSFLFIFTLILFLITQICKHNSVIAELYALNIYPVFRNIIGRVSLIFPFSLGEIFIVLFLSYIILYVIITIKNIVLYKRYKDIKKFLYKILIYISIIYILFSLFCGINYHRFKFSYYANLEEKKYTKKDLITLCEKLIYDANEIKENLYGDVKQEEYKNVDITKENIKRYNEMFEEARKTYYELSKYYEVLSGDIMPIKPVKLSKLMSQAKITGIFFPFTFESNINIDVPQYEMPAVICHEIAHLKGFMDESEANFISYLACINSEYADFRYSGTMLALVYSMNALYYNDYEKFLELREKYSQLVNGDIILSNEYWNKFNTKISKISSSINNTYLKANNQEDGVKSYGKVVDLLLAYYDN